MRKVLAITPIFGRTGSELALFYLLDSLKQEFDITIFTPNDKPLLSHKIDNRISLLFPKTRNFKEGLLSKIVNKFIFKKKASSIDNIVLDVNFDFVLLNTLVSLSFFKSAKRKGEKTVLYIHETEQMLFHLDKTKLGYLINEVDLIICSSNYVKDYIKILGRQKQIEVLYPTLDFSNFNLPIRPNTIRESLGFKESNFVWAMCGDVSSNKNPKMFIDAALKLHKKNKDARFIWIGFTGLRAYEDYLQNIVKSSGLENIVKFIEEKSDDYYEYLNIINGFVLTSLSESFSLVALESACFNKPIVSFPCGGVLEAVPPELLKVTNNFSVDEIVNLMVDTMEEPCFKLQVPEIKKLLINEKTNARIAFLNILNNHSIIN